MKEKKGRSTSKNYKKKILPTLLSIQMLGGLLIAQQPIDASATTTAPVVQVLNPVANSQQVLGKTMLLTGTATDESSTFTIKYQIDEGGVVSGQTLNGSSSSQTFKVEIPIPQNFSTGTHTLKVWAEDSDGNKSPVRDVAFEVNTYAPPTLSGSQVNNYAKLEWATDILDEDILVSSSLEEGHELPRLVYNSSNGAGEGGQSITDEDAFTGEKAYKVDTTTDKTGNLFNYPQTYSNASHSYWSKKYIPNGTPISVSFRAKTTNNAKIDFYGGWVYGLSFMTVNEKYSAIKTDVYVTEYAPVGQNWIKVSDVTGFGYGTHLTTDTDPSKRVWNSHVVEVDAENKILHLASKLNKPMEVNHVLMARPTRTAWSFASKSINAQDGWTLQNVNTKVTDYFDVDWLVEGANLRHNITSTGDTYIDDVKFGYASETFLYRNGQEIYRGYGSTFDDKLATDKAKPNAVQNVTASVSKQKATIGWDKAVDEGTTYDYTAKAIGHSGTETPMSQNMPVSVTSGVKGYSVVVDKNPTTTPDNTVETTTNSYAPTANIQGSFYVHVATIDNQGNVSDITHYSYDDGTAPSVHVESSNTQMTNGDIVLSIGATDSGSGVYRIQLPNGQWVESDNAVFTVTGNGSYTFLVDDHAGNRTTKTVSVQNIDKTAPTIKVTPSTTMPTANPVPLSVVASDSQTGVSRMRLPDGSWVQGGQTTFTAKTNGRYTFVAIDEVGNMGRFEFDVNNIENTEFTLYDATPASVDLNNPSLTLTPDKTTWTSTPVTISVKGEDAETGVFRIKMPNGSYVYSSEASYTTTANGTFSFEAEDGMGNKQAKSITVSNIDRNAPTATLTSNNTSWSKNDVILTFTVSDQESGVKRIQLPDGTWVTGKTSVSYPVGQNGSYAFSVEDVAGNVTTKSIAVSNIDKQAPSVTTSVNTTGWTNQSVTIFVNANDTLSGVSGIQLPNGSMIEESTLSYSVNGNGTYSFIVRDNVGNQTTKTVSVQNIDKSAPTLNLSLNTTETTNNVSINVVAEDLLSGVEKVILPDGKADTRSTFSYPVDKNGMFSFTAVDKVGNQVTREISVQNLDNTPPSPATVTASTTSLTNNDVTLLATFPQDAVQKQYKIGSGQWVAYSSNGVIVSSNSTVYFRSIDQVGNISEVSSYEVTNIDKEAPTSPVITLSNLSPTKTSIDVSISYSSDSKVKQYRVNGGEWKSYAGLITFDDNGKIEARSFDEVGNESSISSYEITSIDKTPPDEAIIAVSTTSLTNKDVEVSIQYPLDAHVKQYKLLSEGVWKTYSGTILLSQNDTVTARSVDVAGNTSNETAVKVANIDKVKPEQPILSADVTKATNQSVTVTATFPTDVYRKEVRINNGSWSVYESPIVMTANGFVEVRGIDQAGNMSDVSSYQVNKIDKIAPQSPTNQIIENQNTFALSGDENSTLFYRFNNGEWKEYTSELKVGDGSYAIEYKAVDEAGNESELQTTSALMYGNMLVEANSKVEVAEMNVAQENVDIAYEKVNLMPHQVEEYQPLMNRLDDLQALLDAQKAIETALETRNETDVQLAKEKITLLNNSNPIILVLLDEVEADFEEADILALVAKERYDLLSSRYQMSKESYTALVNIYYAIKYTGDFMYQYAEEKVALVPSADKHYVFVHEQYDDLLADYAQYVENRVQTDAEIKAESSVKTMETKYDPAMAVNTQNLINAVEDPTVRANLQKRLDDAKAKYEASLLAKADQDSILAVEKAESTKQTYYVSEAYKKVNYLTNTELKFALTTRLQNLEAQMAYERQLADAKRTVELAEQYKYDSYITSAQNKVTTLPDGADKTALQERLNILKAGLPTSDQATIIKQATNYVSLAQSLKTQYYVDKAQGYINQILDATKKAELQAKLDAIVVK